jgi:adenylosuccinate synthase
VLSTWEKVPVCVAYDVDGIRHDEMPMTQTEFHHAKPIYEHLDGWWEDISGCRTFAELPKNAQSYVLALEEMSGTRIWASGSARGASRPSSCATDYVHLRRVVACVRRLRSRLAS